VLGLTAVLCWDLLLFYVVTHCCFVLELTVVLCWDLLLFCFGAHCCFVLRLSVVLCWDLLLFCVWNYCFLCWDLLFFCVGTYCCFVLGLTVVFLISYVPYHIFETCLFSRLFVDIFNPQILDKRGGLQNLLEIKLILELYLSINSSLNPVALFCTSLTFRRQSKRYLTCCCKSKSHPNDFKLTRRK